MFMRRRFVPLALLALSWLVPGCQTPSAAPEVRWTAVPVESFEPIAGRWAGLMVREPRSRQDDWVRVSIADDGRYEFVSYRSIGMFSGKGQFTLAQGQLRASGDRGSVTGGLMTSDGRQMLRFIGVMNDGVQYKAEVQRSR
ncbi:hypothetical protein YTPLAS18_28460 [Nitrospira sp.]|nr:hypothetical protein YTPLAS18_28460 [Nitrospira sp.]